jgi:CBS domain containing-hemolysin-like protein
MDIIITAIVMIACLVAEGFFSGSEIACVSADRIKLRNDAANGSKGAGLAMEMLQKPEWLLSTTLVGTNIAVVTNTTMATALMIELFGPNAGWLAVVLVAPLIWIFGEIVPKSVFQQHADTITPRAIFILKFCSFLFYPILVIFSFLARILGSLLGGNDGKTNPFTLREEIETMMDMRANEGDIQPMEQKMIKRVFDFEETRAHEVMMPLIDVVMIEQGATCKQAREIAIRHNHARIPVYRHRVDRVVGLLDTLELLGIDDDTPIESFIKQIPYVPASKSIQDLLLDMRRNHEQVTVVVDEFGGAEGIVSIEDIIEEVVEEIEDEYDTHEPRIQLVRHAADGSLIVNTRIDISELEDEIGVEFPRGRYASLAGFLLEKVGDIPAAGTSIEYKDLTITVISGTAQSIREVMINRVKSKKSR